MQLEILTLTFKKIGPGVALGCIQTQMVAHGTMAEMLCLSVNSLISVPVGDQANGSSSLKSTCLQQNIILNDFLSFSFFPFSVERCFLSKGTCVQRGACWNINGRCFIEGTVSVRLALVTVSPLCSVVLFINNIILEGREQRISAHMVCQITYCLETPEMLRYNRACFGL